MAITFTDGVFVAGTTGAGKSTLINHIASRFRTQTLLYDTKDEFNVPNVEPIYDIRNVDPKQRIIHLIDPAASREDVDRTFKWVWSRRAGRSRLAYGLTVVVHEAGDLCDNKPNATPPPVTNVARKGRTHGITRIVGAQRPVNITREWRTEVEHVISMAKGFDPEDRVVMAKAHGMSLGAYEAALADARHRFGLHSYLWTDKREDRTRVYPPLPPHLIRRSIATGIDARNYAEYSGTQEATETPERSGAQATAQVPERSGVHSGT